MTISIRTICLMFLCTLVTVTRTHAETITWPKPDFPPFTFVDPFDAMYNEGIDQRVISAITQALPPDWTHRYEEANYKRIVADIIDKKPKIIAGLFKTPARIESGVHYSKIPMHVVLPNQAIILKKNFHKVEPFILDGKIDLKKLMVSEQVTLGVSEGRSYSGIIDSILDQHRNEITTRISSDEVGLFSMLKLGRVDIIIEFPISATYTSRKIGLTDNIMLFPILGMEPCTKAYIAGPSSEWGYKVMGAIDEFMGQPETIKKFALFYSSWLPNESSVAAYHKIVKDYYRSNHGIDLEL